MHKSIDELEQLIEKTQQGSEETSKIQKGTRRNIEKIKPSQK
jgi:hypothetical protein